MKPSEPGFGITHNLHWGVFYPVVEGMEVVFSIRIADFKRAMGLRPRNQEDHWAAEKMAKKNWGLLELIALDAINAECVKETYRKEWRTVWFEIDGAAFHRFFAMREAQVVK